MNLWLWLNLSEDALIVGLVWLAIGVIWLLCLTRGLRKDPPAVAHDDIAHLID